MAPAAHRDETRLIALAEVSRPHGVRGELRLKLYNSDSDLLLDVDEVVLRYPDGRKKPAKLSAARRANDALLVFLDGVSDRDVADQYRGVQILLPRSSFPPAEEGEFYACDVIGAKVQSPEGDVGKVEELLSYPTCDAFVVITPKGRIEIPLVEGMVESVDVEAGVVHVTSRSVLETE